MTTSTIGTSDRSTRVMSPRFATASMLTCALRAKVDASELRTLAAYIKALGGRMEIVADFGGERLVVG